MAIRYGIVGWLLYALVAISASPSFGLEIYLDTNSPAEVSRGSELFDATTWAEAAKAIDGIWFVGQGMTKPPEGKTIAHARKEFIEAHRNLKWIVELSQKAVIKRADGGKSSIYEPKAMKDAGIKNFDVMSFYSERKESTLSAEDIVVAREALEHMGAKDAPLIVNTRGFKDNPHLRKLIEGDSIQGFSFEVPAELLRGHYLESEMVPAIKEAVKHRKTIYILFNADKSKTYLKDVEHVTEHLEKECGPEMASPLVRMVLANYNKGHTTAFTPDRDKEGKYANTTTGAALWLAAAADKHHWREKRKTSE